MLLGMSQEKLGEALGLTFQQVQKYEKGANRIGASRLQQISQTLQVPPSFFFEGAPVPEGDGSAGLSETTSAGFVLDFLGTAEGLQLNKAFAGIKSHLLRRRIIDLVLAMAEESAVESKRPA